MLKVLFATDQRMGFSLKGFLVVTACALAVGAAPLRGQDVNAPAPDEANGAPADSASFQTFYDALGSQVAWIQSSDYGYVWQPQINDPDWAPYTAGHWVSLRGGPGSR
jgi:hypothetical protein